MKCAFPKGLPGPSDLAAILDLPVREASVRLACRAFCDHYKGDSGEEGCGGLAAIRTALSGGRIGADALLRLAGQGPGPARRVPVLVDSLCASCSYLSDGCDFMSQTPVPGASPCGGYRLFLALLDRGLITY